MSEANHHNPNNIDWLGEIPSRWKVFPARALFVERVERKRPESQLLSVSIKYGVTSQADYLSQSVKKDSSNTDKSNYKLVSPGNVVYNKMRAWQGAAGVSNYAGIVSPAYVVLQSRGSLSPRFAHYIMRIPAFCTKVESLSYGISSDQWTLRPQHFKLIHFPVPDLEEQKLIFKFLDHAELRIAKAMQAKQKMVALLNEQKQVIISELVTRGLDPDVPMKHIEHPVLSQIPAEWVVHPFGRALEFISEKNSGNTELLSVYLNRGVIPYSESSGQVHKPSFDLSNYQVVDVGDFVMNNQQAWRGSVGVSKYRGMVSPAYVISRFRNPVDLDYMNFQLRSQSMVGQFEMASRGVGTIQRQLNIPLLKRTMILFPTLEEQRAIAAKIVQHVTHIDNAISAVEREIELLKEYRTVLISDVVTGKKDVRAEASGLPEVDPAELAHVLSGAVSVDGEEDEVDGTSETE